MRSKSHVSILLLLLMTLLQGCTQSGQPKVILFGTVVDAHKQTGIPSAYVSVDGRSVTTGPDGSFMVSGLIVGAEYTFTVQARSYTPFEGRLSTTPSTHTVTIPMHPDGDRIALSFVDLQSDWTALSGNESGEVGAVVWDRSLNFGSTLLYVASPNTPGQMGHPDFVHGVGADGFKATLERYNESFLRAAGDYLQPSQAAVSAQGAYETYVSNVPPIGTQRSLWTVSPQGR